MNIGYARVSTEEQNLDLQRQALERAGCDMIYEDQGISGAAVSRPGLDQALQTLKAGDVLTVWKLDRLGRSLPHLIQIIDGLGKTRAGFVSLSENIDTTTAGGKLYFHMMGALAEFERALIGERTKAGMQAARKRGKHVGRPAGLTAAQIKHAQELRNEGRQIAEIADLFGVHRSTVSRALGRCKVIKT